MPTNESANNDEQVNDSIKFIDQSKEINNTPSAGTFTTRPPQLPDKQDVDALRQKVQEDFDGAQQEQEMADHDHDQMQDSFYSQQ